MKSDIPQGMLNEDKNKEETLGKNYFWEWTMILLFLYHWENKILHYTFCLNLYLYLKLDENHLEFWWI